MHLKNRGIFAEFFEKIYCNFAVFCYNVVQDICGAKHISVFVFICLPGTEFYLYQRSFYV